MIAIDGIQFVRVFKSSANSNSVLVQSSRSISSSQQHDIREWHRSFKGACKYLAQTNSRFSSVQQFLYLFYWKELSPHIHTSTWGYYMIYFAMKMEQGLIPYTQVEVLEKNFIESPPLNQPHLRRLLATLEFSFLLSSHRSS